MNNGFTVSENGVAIHHFNNPVLHGFCLCLYIKAGALYEDDSENGISDVDRCFIRLADLNTAYEKDAKMYANCRKCRKCKNKDNFYG